MMENNNYIALMALPVIIEMVFEDTIIEDEDDTAIINLIADIVSNCYIRGEKPVRILNYYEITIPALSDKQFQSHFRLTREIFTVVENVLSPLIQEKENAHRPRIEPRKQLLMVIWLLATPESYRSVGERFDTAKSTLWVCFYRVVNALNTIAANFIKWPDEDERRIISRNFQKWGRIPNIIGAIDGTYIPIKAPKENPEVYVNRKCFHGITLQAIAEPSLKFTNCFAGYPSSVSDVRIFRNSDIYEKILETPDMYFSNDQFIIGDKAYPVYNWCISPYIDRGNLTQGERHFNHVHASIRQVIERTFALYFGRLRRMQYLDLNRTDLYAMTILAACVLHNMCLLKPDDQIEQYINEGRVFAANNNNIEDEIAINLELMTQEGIHKRRVLTAQLMPRP